MDNIVYNELYLLLIPNIYGSGSAMHIQIQSGQHFDSTLVYLPHKFLYE